MQDHEDDAIWMYQGTQLRTSDVNTAMVHLYRAEVTRANSWRSRLDVTTNWAILSIAAAVSFAFSQPETHHSVIILNALLTTVFLFIEARRYRYYELWSYRVRLMETDFYAALLVPPFSPDADWAKKLAENLLHPQFTISIWEAVGRRLRRNYVWIYLMLLIAWLAKLLLYPASIESWEQIITRARMGIVPGWLVMSIVVIFYASLLVVALATRGLRQAAGEIFPRYGPREEPKKPAAVDPQMDVQPAPSKPYPLLAVVNSEQLDAIAAAISAQFKRDPTRLDPNNTTGTQATLLLPVAVTEIPTLKALVKELDAQGVVVVIPADEVFSHSAIIEKAAQSGD